MGDAGHAGLSKVSELLRQREGNVAGEERARSLPPLAQPGRLLLLLLAQSLESQRTLEVKTISQVSILSVLPKAIDPVMLRQARVVCPWVAHWSPNGATHLLHPTGLRPIHSGRLDRPVRRYGATEEGSVVATTSVGRTELLLLLLTLLAHSWVLRLADPIRKPGDWVLWGEGSSTGRMWRESWVGWGQVVVEGSLGSRGVFSMKQCVGKSNQSICL